MSNDDDKPSAGQAVKWALMALGGVVVTVFVLRTLAPIAILAGAGYLGYRFFSKKKALGGGGRKSLPGGDDYAAKMRKLDALDRKLNRDIGD